ncbi:four helix bundle protein [Psychrobacillus lasiicapitis]|uniref:Four helix bundle protein n=1 Tax=Psychrobacillus lasiicapitis TaxID=1636719 RepID=A0A544T002_9BACI|nr:four helix bundle protein [Psychrobacillus lasiicapitis]GGA43170.1 hypothetical protein GCM10011384_36180 [Psychrobacillus lasiicapitis]
MNWEDSLDELPAPFCLIYKKTYIKHLDSTICSGNEVRAIFDLILDREYITSEQYRELKEEMK